AVVAFVGLTIYQRFFGHKESGGAGLKPETIAGARVFVLPNPSGLNASFPGFDSKLVWFERLRLVVDSLTALRRSSAADPRPVSPSPPPPPPPPFPPSPPTTNAPRPPPPHAPSHTPTPRHS